MRDGAVPRLDFSWYDHDGPALLAPPGRKGFGTELLERTLAFDLKAKTVLDFAAAGLACTIELPLSDGVLMKNQHAH